MRKHIYILFGFISLLHISCSLQQNKDGDNVRVLMKDSIENAVLQKMPISESKNNLIYKGKAYVSQITRQPDEKQPIVKDQQGDIFIDNNITLRITSGDKAIINKTFTKNDFASLIDSQFMKYAILEGLIYDETTAEGFVYIATVSYPQSDLYVPVKLTISPNGNIRMTKEELLENPVTEEAAE